MSHRFSDSCISFGRGSGLICTALCQDARTSDEAKRHAAEVLTAAGYFVEKPDDTTDDEHQTHVIAGYKAALHSEYLPLE